MKVLVLLSLVALCASIPTYLGRRITLGRDGTITLDGGKGYEVDLLKKIHDPRKLITITKTPIGISKTLEIDDTNRIDEVKLRNIFGTEYSTYKDLNQADVLTDILRKYEGPVDENSYNTLLNKIQYLTEAKVLDSSVYDILREWNVDDQLYKVSDIVPVEELARKYNRENVFDINEHNRENIFNTVGRVGLTNEDVLNTIVPTEQYIQYSRIGLEREDGLNRLDNIVPTEEYLTNGYTGLQGNWGNNKNVLNKLYTADHLQTLLQQIKDQRDLQQDLLSQGQLLNQQNWTPKFWNNELTNDDILREIYQYQLRNTENNPLNRFLVNLRLINGQEKYVVPEQFFDNELLENWFAKQRLVNLKVDQMIETQEHGSVEVVYEQRLINQQVEKLIEQLVQHQTLITVQIERYIQMRQVVPQELVYQQRLVYQQVQKLIEKLVYQQTFINDRIQTVLAQNALVHQEYFVQQHVLYQQVFKLIQQLFVQQTVLKQHIQVLLQQGLVVPEELVIFQKMAYEQLESFIEILIRQFVYQQTHFQQLIRLFVQQGRIIPEELVNQYTIIYKELEQLINKGDVVPQQWIYQYRTIHQQIMSLVQQGQVVPEQVVRKWVPEQQRWALFKTVQRLY